MYSGSLDAKLSSSFAPSALRFDSSSSGIDISSPLRFAPAKAPEGRTPREFPLISFVSRAAHKLVVLPY
jgi:hypothetical protein